ncbi:response regulator transcription factor [Cellulosimicrobium cellulans]|uniref:response regulator transcription factor n=1 Tax=Cellulosimicrobium cellulans TaxID=1710 RepID=UPI001ED9EA87|nr:response regulator transcription factor [Cellulosimicrobium cellulans]UKJ62915.1 response regulator transcription factor [Cellulosimicrobium cellulans]
MTTTAHDGPAGSASSRVLVVDDDALTVASVAAHVEASGHAARTATEALEGERVWRAWRPDAVVLDVRLPGRSGLDLLARRRADGDGTPVLLLSGLGTVDDRIGGLEVGADDYVVKPFDARELVLRVEALLRRGPVLVDNAPTRLVVGDLVVDATDRTARYRGRTVALTPREFALLHFLARHPGRAFGRAELLHRVWGWSFGDDSTVMVHVRRLRAKLEDDPGEPTLVVNRRGSGYALVAPSADAPGATDVPGGPGRWGP